MYDPELKTCQEGLPQDINKTLKRRYFLVEKAKNASVIGTTTPSAPCPLILPRSWRPRGATECVWLLHAQAGQVW